MDLQTQYQGIKQLLKDISFFMQYIVDNTLLLKLDKRRNAIYSQFLLKRYTSLDLNDNLITTTALKSRMLISFSINEIQQRMELVI